MISDATAHITPPSLPDLPTLMIDEQDSMIILATACHHGEYTGIIMHMGRAIPTPTNGWGVGNRISGMSASLFTPYTGTITLQND
jgi:hypothetical protein